ncbi:hypothetical protein KQ306_09960 [Synechococcus sp. CS-1324]|uniref:hypothetical protein n=1 Tax=Synechococcus sp. CS-1324 TaxID=2847980 RepID=UPI00223B07E5|nr:hypothetical protein [Synechococcus sp. CS-1324]MCT0231171.1 hypothetical protein [Synechococcus sp. CS-1324]
MELSAAIQNNRCNLAQQFSNSSVISDHPILHTIKRRLLAILSKTTRPEPDEQLSVSRSGKIPAFLWKKYPGLTPLFRGSFSGDGETVEKGMIGLSCCGFSPFLNPWILVLMGCLTFFRQFHCLYYDLGIILFQAIMKYRRKQGGWSRTGAQLRFPAVAEWPLLWKRGGARQRASFPEMATP